MLLLVIYGDQPMLDVIGFLVYVEAFLTTLLTAMFSDGPARLLGFLAAFGYLLLAFWSIDQISSDIVPKRDAGGVRVMFFLNIIAFVFGVVSFYMYTENVVAPIVLLGPGFIIGFWKSVKYVWALRTFHIFVLDICGVYDVCYCA